MYAKSLLVKVSISLLSIATIWLLGKAVVSTLKNNSTDIIISIKGHKDSRPMLSEDDIRSILDRDFNEIMVGVNLAEIDLKAIEERLHEEAYIDRVEVYLDARNKLYIDASPRIPHFRVMHNDGRSYLIDRKGIMFPLSKHYTPRVHIVTGFVPVYKVPLYEEEEGHLLNQLSELITFIQEDELLDALIDEIHVDSNKDIQLIPKIGKHTIVYGKHRKEDMADRFENLKIFYKEGLPYEGWNKYSSINIGFKDQVVCSLK